MCPTLRAASGGPTAMNGSHLMNRCGMRQGSDKFRANLNRRDPPALPGGRVGIGNWASVWHASPIVLSAFRHRQAQRQTQPGQRGKTEGFGEWSRRFLCFESWVEAGPLRLAALGSWDPAVKFAATSDLWGRAALNWGPQAQTTTVLLAYDTNANGPELQHHGSPLSKQGEARAY